jgi:LacI family transcriptional regulator
MPALAAIRVSCGSRGSPGSQAIQAPPPRLSSLWHSLLASGIFSFADRGAESRLQAEKGAVAHAPRVAVLLETSREYGRGLLRGIARYGRLHDPWVLYVAPGHFEQDLPQMKPWHGTGIIARVSSEKLTRAIRASGVPAVILEPSFEELAALNRRLRLCEIRSDSPAIGRLAADHLLERGFRHFGYFGIEGCIWSRVRQEAFTSRVLQSGFACSAYVPPRRLGKRHWGGEQAKIGQWLAGLPRPVGVMSCNDDQGRKLLDACAARGLHVPDDVAVVGVDDDEVICTTCVPPLSSVALDLERAGYEAASLLHRLMRRQPPPSRLVPVRALWVTTRRSTDVVAQDDRVVAAALRFIRENSGHPIRVSDVTAAIDLSRRTVERKFRQVVGRSILDEINRSHVERARRLLLETDLAVSKVADSAGFSNVRAMTRVFRGTLKVSPSRYRAQPDLRGPSS